MKSSLLALTFVAFAMPALQAQTGPAVKVDVKVPKASNIQTPQIQATNTPTRNWRPKEWLEIETDLSVKLPTNAGGRNGSLASMTINYFIGMNAQNKEGKFQLLKGSIIYADVPAGERCHALAYVSPSTLRRVLEKDNFTASSDIKAIAIEVVVDGAVVAGESTIPVTASNKWWEKADAFAVSESVVLSRMETPFSVLWGDYDLPTKSK